MRTFGTDRLAVDGDRFLLSTRRPKGWKPRVPKTFTSAEFPGTAVLWEDEYYEVVEETALGSGGAVRYCLMRWRDEHAIRVAERYDEESERQRLDAHMAAIRQNRNRTSANVFAVLLGNLPAAVQQSLANQLGINAPRMTLLSTIPSLLTFSAAGQRIVGGIITHDASKMPLWLTFAITGWFLESVIRILAAGVTGRPMGSLAGIVGYIVYYYVLARDRTSLVSPFQAEKGAGIYRTEAPPDVALRDDIETRAAFFTLLSADEQRRLAERYGYDYRTDARAIAIIIFLGSFVGVFTSLNSLSQRLTPGALLSLVAAIYLVVEQIVRLASFARGPSGSVLAFLVRPLARKFLG